MLKITTVRKDGNSVTLVVDGSLTFPCSSDLEILCHNHLNVKKKKVFLDLRGVTFIDSEGTKMLKRLQEKELTVIGSTLYIRSLLEAENEKLPDRRSR